VHPHPSNLVTEAVAQASITMAEHLKAAAIVCLTETGFTARQVSKHRPECAILAITSAPDVVRRLAMNWGVFPLFYSGEPTDEARIAFAIHRAEELGYAQPGDVAVVTAGQNQQAGGTNLIRVVSV
jgi:pyruvate kinase